MCALCPRRRGIPRAGWPAWALSRFQHRRATGKPRAITMPCAAQHVIHVSGRRGIHVTDIHNRSPITHTHTRPSPTRAPLIRHPLVFSTRPQQESCRLVVTQTTRSRPRRWRVDVTATGTRFMCRDLSAGGIDRSLPFRDRRPERLSVTAPHGANPHADPAGRGLLDPELSDPSLGLDLD